MYTAFRVLELHLFHQKGLWSYHMTNCTRDTSFTSSQIDTTDYQDKVQESVFSARA